MKAAEALRNMPATEVRMEQVRRLGFGSSDLALTSLVWCILQRLPPNRASGRARRS